jgi:hypothetical protein
MRFNFCKLFGVFLLTVILTLSVSQNLYAATNTPEDVPPTHWAYKAVKLLIDKGYLQLYQDQTFQGDKPVDRYTMASMVAKLLNDSASGQTSINKDDLSILKNLINEFRNELIIIIAKNTEQDKRIDSLEKQDVIAGDELTETKAELIKLQNEAVQLKAQIEQLQIKLEATKQRQTWYIIGAALLGLIGALK